MKNVCTLFHRLFAYASVKLKPKTVRRFRFIKRIAISDTVSFKLLHCVPYEIIINVHIILSVDCIQYQIIPQEYGYPRNIPPDLNKWFSIRYTGDFYFGKKWVGGIVYTFLYSRILTLL